jgi:AcrR family transcriptional regulator
MLKEKKKLKRENIAKSCLELFSTHGFHNVTVSEIAKTAGIGKGTVYEYFANKEDIVLELMECLQSEYDKKLIDLKYDKNIDEKLFIYALFDIFIDKHNLHEDKREILKQFVIATITNPSDSITLYNQTLREKYANMIDEKINNKKIAYILYDAIYGQYLLSLNVEIPLSQKVQGIIEFHLGQNND